MVTAVNKEGSAIIHVTANSTIRVAGDSYYSDLAANGEYVVSASIRRIAYSSPSGNSAYWTLRVAGGSNVAVLDGTGVADYYESGFSFPLTGNVVANLVGSSVGYLQIEFSKKLDPSYVEGAAPDWVLDGATLDLDFLNDVGYSSG